MQQTHSSKVFIKDLRISCIIGVNEGEREAPQDVVINIEMMTDTRQAAQSDNLSDCVDYDQMAQKIRALAERARRFTVEALAEDIAKECLDSSRVKKVTVRVEKPGAVTGAVSAGVEIDRP